MTSRLRSPFAVLLTGWIVFAISVLYFSRFSRLQNYTHTLVLLGQVSCDLSIAFLCFKLRKSAITRIRVFYFILFISFLIEALIDLNLHLTVFIFHHYPLSNLEESSLEILFDIFLILQLVCWIKILKGSDVKYNKNLKLLCISYSCISGVIFYFFIFVFDWKIEFFSLSGTYQVIAVVLDIANFVVISLCLAVSKSIAPFYLSIGTLVLMGTDLLQRFSILNKTYLSIQNTELAWLLGLTLILIGIIEISRNRIYLNYRKWLNSFKSLHSQYTVWCFSICTISLVVFLILTIAIFGSAILFKNETLKLLPSIFVLYAATTAAASNIFAQKMLSPFVDIRVLVRAFINNDRYSNLLSKNAYNNDIPEFKELEQVITKAFLIQNEKIISEKMLSETAVQVAHDIRSPLATLSVIAKDLQSCTNKHQRVIALVIERINSIANNLLTKHNTSRSNENSINELADIHLVTNMLHSVVAEKRVQYCAKEISFAVNVLKNNYSGFININPFGFQRVISNLIDNSVDAISGSGTINISLKKEDDDGDRIAIEISDNGHGIPDEIFHKILNGGFSTKKYGSGLGLVNATKWLHSYKGELNVQSRINVGTTITIKFPLRRP